MEKNCALGCWKSVGSYFQKVPRFHWLAGWSSWDLASETGLLRKGWDSRILGWREELRVLDSRSFTRSSTGCFDFGFRLLLLKVWNFLIQFFFNVVPAQYMWFCYCSCLYPNSFSFCGWCSVLPSGSVYSTMFCIPCFFTGFVMVLYLPKML